VKRTPVLAIGLTSERVYFTSVEESDGLFSSPGSDNLSDVGEMGAVSVYPVRDSLPDSLFVKNLVVSAHEFSDIFFENP
jgi:hypothetical protein